MSGFEVVGVVLGALPLIVTALEHYSEGINTIMKLRRYKSEVDGIGRQLRQQQAIFINCCERLLDGVVTAEQAETLIRRPGEGSWSSKETKRLIKVRLGSDLEDFLSTIEDTRKKLITIQRKLDLGPNGEQFSVDEVVVGFRCSTIPSGIQPAEARHVKHKDRQSIKREFKRASIVLVRAEYTETLDSIHRNNQYLSDILIHSLDVHISKRRRNQTQKRIISLLHNISRSIYHTLRSSISCSCPETHRANLELTKPKLVAEDDDEQLASQFNFRVALSSERSDAGLGPTTTGWKEMILRVYEQETYLTEPEQPSRRPTLAKPRKSVRFSIVAKSQDQPHMVAHTEDLSSASFGLRGAVASVALDNAIAMGLPSLISRFSSGLPQVVDICRTLADAQSQPTVECYGYLTDTLVQSRRFGIYPAQTSDTTRAWPTFTLRDVLNDKSKSLPSLWYRHQLRLAVVLSCSVLQLYNTPWLPGLLTSKDVLFVRQNDRTVYDRPYLAKRLPEDTVNTSTQVTAAGHTPTVQNPTVFYLGILLIELLLGDTLDNIRTANNWKVDPNVPELERDFDTAQKLLPRVMEKGEANYHTAVKRCVNCMFESENAGDLEDAAFRQEVYEKVVGPLEEGLQLTQM